MSFGPFGFTRYTQKWASAVFRAGGRPTWRQLFLVDNLAYWLWLWNGDIQKWGLPLEQTFEFVYPFTGGSAAAHSFNLVDPARGRITWVGGVTHDQFGIKGNGTNGFGKTGIRFAGNLAGGGSGVTAAETHVIFGVHVYTGTASGTFDMGNWIQNIPSPPAAPGTVSTSYAGIITKNLAGLAQYWDGTSTGHLEGPVPNPYGFRACMRYADNGLLGYHSTTATTLVRTAVVNTTTNAEGNEGEWCLLISGVDDTVYSAHTIMSAFLTKSNNGVGQTYGYVFTDAKMNELWSDFQTFNQYMGRASIS